MKTVIVTFDINRNPSKRPQEEIGRVTLKKTLLLKKIVKHYLDIFEYILCPTMLYISKWRSDEALQNYWTHKMCHENCSRDI
jgi:hypothetical protein